MCGPVLESPASRAAWAALIFGHLLVAAGCGSSTMPGNPSSPGSSAPVPVTGAAQGSLAIRVITSAGAPIADVAVSLNGGFDGRTAHSDDAGWVRFDDIPAGEARASSYVNGFHAAGSRFTVAPGVETSATLILEDVTEATPVVLGTRAVAASDGRSLTVDVDLAILDAIGRADSRFISSDFQMVDSDCAFVPCGYDADLVSMPMGGYSVLADGTAFRWDVRSDGPTPPMAVGLLLDQSASMVGYDPVRLRLPPVRRFLQSVLPPDTVSLATYRDTNGLGVDFRSYGPFTSDGAQFVDEVDALAGTESGGNPLYEAVSYMRWWTAQNAPGGATDAMSSVVVLTSNDWDAGYGALRTEPFADYAAGLDIPVITIGGGELGATLAAGSGGAFVVVDHPRQYDVAMGSLARIVGRTLDSNHLRFVLTPVGAAATGPVFRPGRQSVWAYLYVRIGPHTQVEIPLVMSVE